MWTPTKAQDNIQVFSVIYAQRRVPRDIDSQGKQLSMRVSDLSKYIVGSVGSKNLPEKTDLSVY